MSDFLKCFTERFASLDANNLTLARLAELYHATVHFQDPLHEIQAYLHDYFTQLYANVSELTFDFHGFDQVRDGEGYLRWSMRFRHPRLNGGQLIEVEGCSHLRWVQGKVAYHRDYFDAGAMLYEQLPLLGRLIGWLKGRLA
jgi:hypothetical protein